MATSTTDIANGALQLLGQGAIASLEGDTSPNAREMYRAYDRVRRKLLRIYDWSFSFVRASVASDPTQTVWGGHNRYSLPGDYLRLILDDESKQAVDWQIEGRFIVTDDASPLMFRYVADITDVTLFDSAFQDAFENRLAFVCCKRITGSTDLRARLKDEFTDTIEEAKRIGAIEKPAQFFLEDDWVNARL